MSQSIASIAVVIGAYNEAAHLNRCIDSLLAQTQAPDRIVVVNDGSTDNSQQLLDAYADQPGFEAVHLKPNQGTPSARNVGIARCEEDIIAFLDADAYVPEHWIEALGTSFEDEETGAAGGPDRLPEDSNHFAMAADYSMHSLLGSGGLRGQNPFTSYNPAACNLWIRRSVLEEVGNFNPLMDRRGEEKELTQRIRRAGWQITHNEQAWIWHFRRPTVKQYWRQCFLSGCARIDILRLAPDAFALPHFAPMMIFLLVSASLIGSIAGFSFGPTILGLYLLYLLADAALGFSRRLSLVSIIRVPMTTALLHFGYGLGSLVGLYRWLRGCPPGSGTRGLESQCSS